MGGITTDQLPISRGMAIKPSGFLWASAVVPRLISEDCQTSVLEHVLLVGRNWEMTNRWPERHLFWSYGKEEEPIHGNGAALVRNLKELVAWANLERKGGWRGTERLHDAPPPLPSAFDVWCAFVIGLTTATPGPNGKTVVVHYCLNNKFFSLLARANLNWLVPAISAPPLFDNAEYYWARHPSYTGPALPPDLDMATLMLGPKPTSIPRDTFKATRKTLNSCRAVPIDRMANNPPGNPQSITAFANNPPTGGAQP
ncbi:hypothetical protein B0T14DRAFT_497822 [Immersiella caudata]|uniref:Uncharacterized protein n=1 Tax=Immersiella caudata TaxID=314043 RepID=A0AA40BWU4_9PEZI|nr:hypothetical protein B0T14DRAFT_497822 [Immersiella caudata]